MTGILGAGWLELAGFAAAVVALDSVFVWMERRGWIYWRGGTPSGALSQARDAPPPEPERLDRRALVHARRDWPALRPDQTVGQALDSLRHAQLPARVVCLYVADSDGRLAGVVPTRRLLGANLDARVGSIMARDMVSLPRNATVDQAADALLENRLLAVPIVDDGGRLLGVIDIGLVAERCRGSLPGLSMRS